MKSVNAHIDERYHLAHLRENLSTAIEDEVKYRRLLTNFLHVEWIPGIRPPDPDDYIPYTHWKWASRDKVAVTSLKTALPAVVPFMIQGLDRKMVPFWAKPFTLDEVKVIVLISEGADYPLLRRHVSIGTVRRAAKKVEQMLWLRTHKEAELERINLIIKRGGNKIEKTGLVPPTTAYAKVKASLFVPKVDK